LWSPYWRSAERGKSGLLLAAIIGLDLGTVYINVLINEWNAVFYNALQDKDFSAFSYRSARFSVLAGAFLPASLCSPSQLTACRLSPNEV